MDGVSTHHMSTGDNDAVTRQAADLICRYCERPTAANKAAIYDQILKQPIVALVDKVLERLRERERALSKAAL